MNKTILITGASRGIGYHAAKAFAQNGYQVAANFFQTALPLKQLANEYPNLLPIKADVSDRNQVEQMINTVRQAFGSIDVLVNNAGIAQQKLFTDLTDDDWSHMLDINLNSVFYCCRAVLPDMIHAKYGKIINISSVWGISGASCEVHYSAAKAAIIGLTKALAKEEGPSGITVNCIAPGVIDTDMNRQLTDDDLADLKADTPLEKLGTPMDVVHAIQFLASEQADFITGQVIRVDGGFGQ